VLYNKCDVLGRNNNIIDSRRKKGVVTVLALARVALFPIRLRLEVSEPQHI
jgi:hypothetical protein